ncbi:MAG: ribonuclease R [Gammaproteobacteria bacterium]
MPKKRAAIDPFADREAKKYENPIASREAILAYLSGCNGPQSIKNISVEFGLLSDQALDALKRRLGAMERDGQLVQNRRGGYGIPEKMDLVRGHVIGHADGFGFLVADDGGDDVFLSARQMRTIFHGDRALVRITGIDRRGRREGAVVEVLEHNTRQLVGRFFIESGIGFVQASNKRISHDIIIPPDQQLNANNGQIVVVGIIQQPSFRYQPVGKVVEILGDHMAPGMEMEIAIRDYDIPFEWSELVVNEVDNLPAEVTEQSKQGREDLRELPLVTIDGEDSRDFDDAVFSERQGKGYRLIVAIADVSHYVLRDSSLDEEARARGNSVYFPQNVIPMLPEVLSNHLCSLNEQVDRLCLACEMSISSTGKLKKFRFFDAVVRSHARLTYNKVADILIKKDVAVRKEYNALIPHLENLFEVYKTLRSARIKRGAIDFDSIETRIVFGEHRKIEKIVPVHRNDAHRMIEECMILANIAAAEYLLENEIPALYRIHQEPGLEKITDLRSFLGEFGLNLGGGETPQAKDYAKLISSIADREDHHLIETVMLRSLSQAVYSPENIGHFGLALPSYAHFTSPIRRYPDLIVHRAIRHLIHGKEPKDFDYGGGDMQELGGQCSMTERRADEATRDAVDWLKCEYMSDKVGEHFSGIISAVTSFGIFVELEDIFVEGLVHVTSLVNDYYHFDPIGHRLVGERTGVTYRLADKVDVIVTRVDLDEKKIDFNLAENDDSTFSERKKRKKHNKRRKKK